jgi:uncharacterized protein YjbJ (UPF0337 family)
MNWNEVDGKWKQMKGSVREKWGKLTDDDLQMIGGKKDQFIGKLQERYGMSQEQANKDLDVWLASTHMAGTHAEAMHEGQAPPLTRTSGGGAGR